jgi:hypothetical protein
VDSFEFEERPLRHRCPAGRSRVRCALCRPPSKRRRCGLSNAATTVRRGTGRSSIGMIRRSSYDARVCRPLVLWGRGGRGTESSRPTDGDTGCCPCPFLFGRASRPLRVVVASPGAIRPPRSRGCTSARQHILPGTPQRRFGRLWTSLVRGGAFGSHGARRQPGKPRAAYNATITNARTIIA